MFHREFVEELAPHVAANDTDDGEHAGDLVDGNDEVVVGKGGHVVLPLDELV